MDRLLALMLALALVAGCDGTTGKDNPFEPDPEVETDPEDEEDPTTPIDSDRELPPGTPSPTPDNAIIRYEADDGEGGGQAQNIRYINENGEDQFMVDNLAFDGDNVYERGDQVSSIGSAGPGSGPFQVYEASPQIVDDFDDETVDNLTYRAIYGRSATGQVEFAIVRTGSYSDYGFGGFVYQRNNTDLAGDPVILALPETGTAAYAGAYGGVRIFKGTSGMQYTSGDASMTVDFEDFNQNRAGVLLRIRNRRVFDIDGNDVTNAFLDQINAAEDSKDLASYNLPNLGTIVTPNMSDPNGEITAGMFSNLVYDDGSVAEYETGNFYAIMSGENAEEIVGVVVITSQVPGQDGVTAQETGGFIVYR